MGINNQSVTATPRSLCIIWDFAGIFYQFKIPSLQLKFHLWGRDHTHLNLVGKKEKVWQYCLSQLKLSFEDNDHCILHVILANYCTTAKATVCLTSSQSAYGWIADIDNMRLSFINGLLSSFNIFIHPSRSRKLSSTESRQVFKMNLGTSHNGFPKCLCQHFKVSISVSPSS